MLTSTSARMIDHHQGICSVTWPL